MPISQPEDPDRATATAALCPVCGSRDATTYTGSDTSTSASKTGNETSSIDTDSLFAGFDETARCCFHKHARLGLYQKERKPGPISSLGGLFKSFRRATDRGILDLEYHLDAYASQIRAGLAGIRERAKRRRS